MDWRTRPTLTLREVARATGLPPKTVTELVDEGQLTGPVVKGLRFQGNFEGLLEELREARHPWWAPRGSQGQGS